LAQEKVTEEWEEKLDVTPLVVLREQDFGFYEGKPFSARPRDSNRSGKDDHRFQHQDDPDFKDVESKLAMASRMNAFVQGHLVPILHGDDGVSEYAIAIVSHGIILSQLWRCFLKLFSRNSVALSPGLSVGSGGVTPLEHLGGWSNTGYLELDIQRQKSEGPLSVTDRDTSSPCSLAAEPPMVPVTMSDFKMTIETVNGKEHLQGLVRTRGVGSSKFDEGQKSIEAFFKKKKV